MRKKKSKKSIFGTALLLPILAALLAIHFLEAQQSGDALESEGLFPTTMEEIFEVEPERLEDINRRAPEREPLTTTPRRTEDQTIQSGGRPAQPQPPRRTEDLVTQPGLRPVQPEPDRQTSRPITTTTAERDRPEPLFLPEPATRREPARPETLTPTRETRQRPITGGDRAPGQVLLPAPAPVAEALQTPTSPTILFGDTQVGLEDETVEETGPLFDPGELLANKEYEELEPWVLENEDIGMAGALGWSYYNDENYPKAIEWFEQALRWDENQNEAAYGLALSLYNEGYLQQAEAVAQWKMNVYPDMRDILGDIYMTRAISSFRDRRYEETIHNVERIKRYRSLTRGEKILEAWSHYHMDDLERAATQFQELYVEQRDQVAAVGLYSALSRMRDWSRIQRLSNQYGGPLQEIYARYTSERYFERRLYLRAQQVVPGEQDPELMISENIDSPNMSLSGEYIDRDGDPGTSRLIAFYGPKVSGTVYSDGINRLDVSVAVVNLDTKNLPAFATVGLFPTEAQVPYAVDPKTSYNGMIEPTISFYREDWLSPFAELGMTPLRGQVDSTFTGQLGIVGLYDSGSWTLGAYRESITESLLSYTGMRDPYTGLEWGRVVETGVRVSIFHSFMEVLNLYGEMEVAQITGSNVEDNDKFAVMAALSRTFTVDGFNFINFGPSASFATYNKNLSQFTYGQGGYFSPEYLVQGLIGSQFLTKEGRDFILGGQLGFGIQTNKQAASPLFPLNADGRIFEARTETTGIFISSLEGMVFLTPRWAFGANVGYNKTPSYEEFRGGIFTTIFFEPRTGLVESDIPDYRY